MYEERERHEPLSAKSSLRAGFFFDLLSIPVLCVKILDGGLLTSSRVLSRQLFMFSAERVALSTRSEPLVSSCLLQ